MVCHFVPSRVLRHLADHPATSAEHKRALHRSADRAIFARGLRAGRQHAALGVTRVGPAPRHRDVYDAAESDALPGQLKISEGGKSVQVVDANYAYSASGTVWDFYSSVLGRNSIDGRGLRLESTVRSSRAPDNAFWDGSQMVYGEPTPNGPFVGCLPSMIDVVAHELTHGVTQYSVPGGGLNYEGQSGALNESVSDVFGSVVKQWSLNQDVDQADWLIGAGLLGPQYGRALRDMAQPGTAWSGDDQPADMDGYVQDGDVHTNSGIPNRAFYLAAKGIGGHSADKAARIWYYALAHLSPEATFKDAAMACVSAADVLYGRAKAEWEAVSNAWSAVKVL